MGGEGRGAGAGVWTRGQAATWETGRKPRAETGSAPDTATHARTRARVCTDAHAHTSARAGTARGSGELGGTARVRKGGARAGSHAGSQKRFPESAPGSERGLVGGQSGRRAAGNSRHEPRAAQPGGPSLESGQFQAGLGNLTQGSTSLPLYTSPLLHAPSPLWAPRCLGAG